MTCWSTRGRTSGTGPSASGASGANGVLRTGSDFEELGDRITATLDPLPNVVARTVTWHTATSFVVARLTGTAAIDHHQASYFGPAIDARARTCHTFRSADGGVLVEQRDHRAVEVLDDGRVVGHGPRVRSVGLRDDAVAHDRRVRGRDADRLGAFQDRRRQAILPKAGEGDLGEGGIENWLIAQTLRREAEELLSEPDTSAVEVTP